jgi:hypothetical protein
MLNLRKIHFIIGVIMLYALEKGAASSKKKALESSVPL